MREIAAERGSLIGLLDVGLREEDVAAILFEAGFKGYRFDAALAWVMKALAMVDGLGYA